MKATALQKLKAKVEEAKSAMHEAESAMQEGKCGGWFELQYSKSDYEAALYTYRLRAGLIRI